MTCKTCRSASAAKGLISDSDSPISRRVMVRQMAYSMGGAIAGSLLLGGHSLAGQSELMPHDWLLPKDLRVQYSDDFHTFDEKQWMPLLFESEDNHATVGVENGRVILRANTSLRPEPPGGALAAVGIATRGKWFNPGLRGTAGVEVTAISYKHEGDYVFIHHPGFGDYPMGWTLTISNYQRPVGMRPAGDERSVQLIFDWWSKHGLANHICRSFMPGDEQYPEFRDWLSSAEVTKPMSDDGHQIIDGKKVTWENMPKPFYDPPCVIPASKLWPAGEESERVATSRRVGLFITNNGNMVHWTLDGRVINSAQMTGFASSKPDAFRDGAYVTIYANGGYPNNIWEYDDVKIYKSA